MELDTAPAPAEQHTAVPVAVQAEAAAMSEAVSADEILSIAGQETPAALNEEAAAKLQQDGGMEAHMSKGGVCPFLGAAATRRVVENIAKADRGPTLAQLRAARKTDQAAASTKAPAAIPDTPKKRLPRTAEVSVPAPAIESPVKPVTTLPIAESVMAKPLAEVLQSPVVTAPKPAQKPVERTPIVRVTPQPEAVVVAVEPTTEALPAIIPSLPVSTDAPHETAPKAMRSIPQATVEIAPAIIQPVIAAEVVRIHSRPIEDLPLIDALIVHKPVAVHAAETPFLPELPLFIEQEGHPEADPLIVKSAPESLPVSFPALEAAASALTMEQPQQPEQTAPLEATPEAEPSEAKLPEQPIIRLEQDAPVPTEPVAQIAAFEAIIAEWLQPAEEPTETTVTGQETVIQPLTAEATVEDAAAHTPVHMAILAETIPATTRPFEATASVTRAIPEAVVKAKIVETLEAITAAVVEIRQLAVQDPEASHEAVSTEKLEALCEALFTALGMRPDAETVKTVVRDVLAQQVVPAKLSVEGIAPQTTEGTHEYKTSLAASLFAHFSQAVQRRARQIASVSRYAVSSISGQFQYQLAGTPSA